MEKYRSFQSKILTSYKYIGKCFKKILNKHLFSNFWILTGDYDFLLLFYFYIF